MVIWFLSAAHPYNDTRVLLKECASLARAGHEVTHVAPGEKSAAFSEHGVTVVTYPRRSGLVGRLMNLCSLFAHARRARPDAVHCNEPDSWLIGVLLKLLRPNTVVVFDVHEHYPSRFTEPHVHPLVRLVGRPSFPLFIRLLSLRTDYFVFAKLSVAADYPAEGRNTFLFNYAPLNCADRSLDDVPNRIRALYDGPVLLHIGAYSRARGWPQTLEALARTKHESLKLYCLGTVAEGNDCLLDEARRLGVSERVRLFERMDYTEMFDHLLCADVGGMFYQPGILNHTYAFPMKLYDYMLARLAVIAPDFSVEVAPIVREERIGYLVDTSDPVAIARALDELFDDPEEMERMGERAREAVNRRYNWPAEETKLIALYDRFSLSQTGDSAKKVHFSCTDGRR